MEKREASKGEIIPHEGGLRLYLLAEGEIELRSGRFLMEVIRAGDFWGETAVTDGREPTCEARAMSSVTYYAIPARSLKEYPGVYLKLLEAFDRRMKALRTKFGFGWQDFYSVGVKEIDDQHKELFMLIKSVAEGMDSAGDVAAYRERLAALLARVREHFTDEEALLERRGYPKLAAQREEHRKLLAQLEERMADNDSVLAAWQPAESFFKDWLITHTLLEDRLFKDFLSAPRAEKKSRGKE
jgi:hemerythrin